MIEHLLDELYWPNLSQRLKEIKLKEKDGKICIPSNLKGDVRVADLFRRRYTGTLAWVEKSELEEFISSNLEQVAGSFIKYVTEASGNDSLIIEQIDLHKYDLDMLYIIFITAHEAFKEDGYIHTGRVRARVLSVLKD